MNICAYEWYYLSAHIAWCPIDGRNAVPGAYLSYPGEGEAACETLWVKIVPPMSQCCNPGKQNSIA